MYVDQLLPYLIVENDIPNHAINPFSIHISFTLPSILLDFSRTLGSLSYQVSMSFTKGKARIELDIIREIRNGEVLMKLMGMYIFIYKYLCVYRRIYKYVCLSDP